MGISIDVLIRESPAHVLTLAAVMRNRLDEFSTKYHVKLTNDLLGTAPKVPDDRQEELEKLLYDQYRPVLVARWKTDAGNMELIDAILSLLALEDPDAGWQELGKERHPDRMWRFTSIEPKGADVLHPREGKRFRNITLPAELQGWFEPGFDDSGWKQGKAPIGVGLRGDPKAWFKNESPWGDDEFVLMRSPFELAGTDFDYVRIRVRANQGFEIYLNGRLLSAYGWWNSTPEYSKVMQGDRSWLKKGTNHLAVRAGSDYHNGVHVGQIAVYLEGLRKEDLLDRRKR